MKRLVLLTAVVALASAVNLWAAEQPGALGGGVIVVNAGAGAVANPASPWGAGKSAAAWYIESIDKIVGLTEAQKKAITEIIEARDKSMKDFQTQSAEKLKAASNAMMEAYKSKNQDDIAKAQKAYQDLYAPMHQIMKKSQADLTNVLTAEQKAKLQESRVMSLVKSLTAPVQLSEEQIKQVKAAAGELMKDDDPQGYMKGYGKLNEVIQQILTPEQKATIAKNRAMSSIKARFWAAKLTADQMEQVEAACDELVKDQTIKSEEVYKKLTETVDRLLTDEQKEALKKGRGGFWTVQPGQPGAYGGVVQEVPERK
jgi:Spy/CpxP family protein refolding chaperone